METSKSPLLTNQGREPAAKGRMQALVGLGMHYIRDGEGIEELYVLKSDPEERANFAGAPNAQASLQRFRSVLRSMLTRNHRSTVAQTRTDSLGPAPRTR